VLHRVAHFTPADQGLRAMSTTDRPPSRQEIEGRPMTEAEEQYPLEPHLLDGLVGAFISKE
jgi:hypothetical protein